MENLVKIPLAYQVVMDDIGWFTGADDRHLGMPSRSGMTRNHVAEDYLIINEIGKRIGQKICGAFVIGEWDKNNRLRGKAHMTPKPYEWNCQKSINMPEAERCFEAIENSEYLDVALHGLLHSYWDEEMGHDDQQYYIRPRKGYTGSETIVPVSEEYFADCIETFINIYNDWGFTKKLTSFISPGSAYGPVEKSLGFAKVLRARGFTKWANYWRTIKQPCEIIGGLTFVNKGTGCVPWNAYDVNPDLLPDYCLADNDGVVKPRGTIFGLHWPNFLRFDPNKNFEQVDAWVNFFRRQSEIFGLMISRDMSHAAHQAQYARYTKMSFGDGEIILDFDAVDACPALDKSDEMYISLAKRLVPTGAIGADISLYETKRDFCTYSLKRKGNRAVITLK